MDLLSSGSKGCKLVIKLVDFVEIRARKDEEESKRQKIMIKGQGYAGH